MPKRETIAAANLQTTYDVARLLQDVNEQWRITPAQFQVLATVIGGYVPTHATLEQRTPKGTVYVTIRTADDESSVTVDGRARVRYG